MMFLVANLDCFDNNAMIGPLRIFALFADCCSNVDRVTDKDGADKTHAIISIGHRMRVDIVRCHSHGNAEDERAVSNPSPKRLRIAPSFIHMMRMEIASLAGMKNDIGFSNGATGRNALIAHFVLFKKDAAEFHWCSLSSQGGRTM